MEFCHAVLTRKVHVDMDLRKMMNYGMEEGEPRSF